MYYIGISVGELRDIERVWRRRLWIQSQKTHITTNSWIIIQWHKCN